MRHDSVTPSNVIWLASYPKSGNTWFRILLANLKSGRDQPVDINDSIDYFDNILSRERFDDMTMLASGLLTLDEVDLLRPSVGDALAAETPPNNWVKVHNAWWRTPAGEPLLGRNSARAAIYLVRDPRDVAVSYAHHEGMSIDSAIDFLNWPGAMIGLSRKGQNPHLPTGLGDWSGHVASWLDQTDVPVHVARYEDLVENAASTFENALRFAGEPADIKDVERAVRFSDFMELTRQEQAAGFCEQSLSGNSPFFRRGQPGAWCDELSEAEAARIVDAHGPMMRRLGYLPDAVHEAV
jgi:aryl sulfotransferase